MPAFAKGDLASRLDAYPMRDPQAAAHAADGAARATGKPAVVIARGLADVLRVASGLVIAAGDRQPVVAILALDEDELAIANSCLETAARSVVRGIEGHAEIAAQCTQQIRLNAPVAVIVDRGADLAGLSAAVRQALSKPAPSQLVSPGADDLDPLILSELRETKRPVILLGNGAASTSDLSKIATLARIWQAPVCLTFAATSMPPHRLEECIAVFGADVPVLPAGTVPWTAALTRCDRVLALGSGLSEADWFGLSDARLVRAPVTRIALDPEPDGVAQRTVVADAGEFAGLLHDELLRGGVLTRDGWLERFADARSKWSALVDEEAHKGINSERLTPALAAREIVSAAPADGILIGEGGAAGMWLASYAWLRPLILAAQHAPIGASIAMAAGASAAQPQRAVWCVVGDGAFFYCARELASLAERGVPVAVFVFDDRSWNAIRLVQTLFFGHRTIGTDLPEVDYGAHAELHGCKTVKVRTPGELARALSLAQEPRGVPLVVDVKLEKGSIPFVGVNLILAELDGVITSLAGSTTLGSLLAGARDRPALAAMLRVTIGALRK